MPHATTKSMNSEPDFMFLIYFYDFLCFNAVCIFHSSLSLYLPSIHLQLQSQLMRAFLFFAFVFARRSVKLILCERPATDRLTAVRTIPSTDDYCVARAIVNHLNISANHIFRFRFRRVVAVKSVGRSVDRSNDSLRATVQCRITTQWHSFVPSAPNEVSFCACWNWNWSIFKNNQQTRNTISTRSNLLFFRCRFRHCGGYLLRSCVSANQCSSFHFSVFRLRLILYLSFFSFSLSFSLYFQWVGRADGLTHSHTHTCARVQFVFSILLEDGRVSLIAIHRAPTTMKWSQLTRQSLMRTAISDST